MHHQWWQGHKSLELKFCYSCHDATLPWIGVDNIHCRTDYWCQLLQTQHLKRHNFTTASQAWPQTLFSTIAQGIYMYLVRESVKASACAYSLILGDLVQKIISARYFCWHPWTTTWTLKQESNLRKDNSWLHWQISLKEDRFTKLSLTQTTLRPCKEKAPCLAEKVEMKVEQQSYPFISLLVLGTMTLQVNADQQALPAEKFQL